MNNFLMLRLYSGIRTAWRSFFWIIIKNLYVVCVIVLQCLCEKAVEVTLSFPRASSLLFPILYYLSKCCALTNSTIVTVPSSHVGRTSAILSTCLCLHVYMYGESMFGKNTSFCVAQVDGFKWSSLVLGSADSSFLVFVSWEFVCEHFILSSDVQAQVVASQAEIKG